MMALVATLARLIFRTGFSSLNNLVPFKHIFTTFQLLMLQQHVLSIVRQRTKLYDIPLIRC